MVCLFCAANITGDIISFRFRFCWIKPKVFKSERNARIKLILCSQINLAIISCRLSTVKDLMQGKLFQKCTHVLYCSVLSLGGNVNTRRKSKPEMGSIFHINNQWNILVIGNYYVNYQNYQNSMLLTSSDTLRHLFLFTNSAQRELVSICTQSIRNCN